MAARSLAPASEAARRIAADRSSRWRLHCDDSRRRAGGGLAGALSCLRCWQRGCGACGLSPSGDRRSGEPGGQQRRAEQQPGGKSRRDEHGAGEQRCEDTSEFHARPEQALVLAVRVIRREVARQAPSAGRVQELTQDVDDAARQQEDDGQGRWAIGSQAPEHAGHCQRDAAEAERAGRSLDARRHSREADLQQHHECGVEEDDGGVCQRGASVLALIQSGRATNSSASLAASTALRPATARNGRSRRTRAGGSSAERGGSPLGVSN